MALHFQIPKSALFPVGNRKITTIVWWLDTAQMYYVMGLLVGAKKSRRQQPAFGKKPLLGLVQPIELLCSLSHDPFFHPQSQHLCLHQGHTVPVISLSSTHLSLERFSALKIWLDKPRQYRAMSPWQNYQPKITPENSLFHEIHS